MKKIQMVDLKGQYNDIKDVAEAVERYGKIYTMQKIVSSKVTGLKIQLLAKTYFAE